MFTHVKKWIIVVLIKFNCAKVNGKAVIPGISGVRFIRHAQVLLPAQSYGKIRFNVHMAIYYALDAVTVNYLYGKYVHLFNFFLYKGKVANQGLQEIITNALKFSRHVLANRWID